MSISNLIQAAKTRMQNFPQDLSQFNVDYKDKDFGHATKVLLDGLEGFEQAHEAFKNGDTQGGAAAVLRGIGSTLETLTLLGPAGAAFGGVLNIVLSIISAILDALKPPSESLVSKIEKLIMEETLRSTADKITAGLKEWKTVELEIDSWIRSGREITLEYVNQTMPSLWSHYRRINDGFSTLSSHAKAHSSEWLPLFELNIIYTLRFWIYLENLTLLICKKRTAPNPQSHEMLPLKPTLEESRTFYNIRQTMAKDLLEDILGIHYSSVNEVDFHSLWFSSGIEPYLKGSGDQGLQANPIYHRVGVLEGSDNQDLGTGQSNCFAIAASGTIFSVGTHPTTLYVGRAGTEWETVPKDIFGDDVEQVAIGELGDDRLLVVCIHGKGTKISFCNFDDRAGTAAESKRGGWTPGTWRWGTWGHHAVSGQMGILSIGIAPQLPNWGLYAFAVSADGVGKLYDVRLSDQYVVQMTEIANTFIGRKQLSEFTYDITPTTGRSEISPCTISCVGKNIYSQVGNWVHYIENGKLDGWNLRDLLGISDLKVYQARFYADGSGVFATDKGIIMRYFDYKESAWRIYKDEVIKTVWFSKAVANQALTARELMAQLKTAASQPVEELLQY